MIRVLLADDQALVRAGFRALLDVHPDIEVVAEAADGAEAVRSGRGAAPRYRPDGHPHAGARRAGRPERILADARLPATRVVILTTFDLDEYIFEALRLGASGFLVKDTEPEDLIAGRAGRGRRRGAAVAERHPPPHRRVSPGTAAPPRPGPAAARR